MSIARGSHDRPQFGGSEKSAVRRQSESGKGGSLRDVSRRAEIITGDLPTPVKYFNSEIRAAYQEVENMAKDRLLSMLPEDLRQVYEPLLAPGEEEKEILRLVKAADKISALIKCIEEKSMGNAEFCQAELALREAVSRLRCPEV